MNLMEESLKSEEKIKKRRKSTIILVAIFIVLIAIISIIVYLVSVKNSMLKIYLNGQTNEKIKDTLLIEDDGTVYVGIRAISGYLGYDSYKGDYAEKSEEKNKCYIESKEKDEIANFELGSSKIYKLDLTKSNDDRNYEYVYVEKPVKSNEGELYATSEAIEKAFNISFEYDKDKNRITIYTMPYLISAYSNKVLDSGYKEISDILSNKKAVLDNMLVVKKEDGTMGVISIQNQKNILEAKYNNIVYLPSIGDFIVETNKKIGVLSKDGTTKIRAMYDSIELMDQDAGLYLVKEDSKYGVLDTRGNVKIDINNDDIGIDISRFEKNEIKNKYILAENLIPVKRDRYWGLYDKYGNQVVDFTYDSFGYISSNNKNISLLMIPDYNVIVACKDRKYTLLDSLGNQLFLAPIADDIYMTIEGNEKKYTIYANNKLYDAIEFLESQGINVKDNTQDSSSKTRVQEKANSDNNNQTTEEEKNDEQNSSFEQNDNDDESNEEE